jgi:hypothetical protein
MGKNELRQDISVAPTSSFTMASSSCSQKTPETQSSLSPQQEVLLMLRESNQILSMSERPAQMWVFIMMFAVYLWRQEGRLLSRLTEALFIEVSGGQITVTEVDAKKALIAYEATLLARQKIKSEAMLLAKQKIKSKEALLARQEIESEEALLARQEIESKEAMLLARQEIESEKVVAAWCSVTEFPSKDVAVFWMPKAPQLSPMFAIFSRQEINKHAGHINSLRNNGLTDQMLADEADALARGHRAKKLEQRATQKNESDLLARSNAACAAEVQTTKDDADGGDESVGAVVTPAE